MRVQTDGGAFITDGPHPETKEHVGVFSILECRGMGAQRRRPYSGQVEVREIFFNPAKD
jgi:hypothetical protein